MPTEILCRYLARNSLLGDRESYLFQFGPQTWASPRAVCMRHSRFPEQERQVSVCSTFWPASGWQSSCEDRDSNVKVSVSWA